MLDFKELPEDGTAFEQLLREMFLAYEMAVHWTGKGPDHGRDLMVVEKLSGRLADSTRTWLVQCKHYAHSGKTVGRNDIASLIDDCKQAGATGYLLACSTMPSAGLVTKLAELSAQPQNDLVARSWDHVEIERRRWTANYGASFVILACRVGGEPPSLQDCSLVIDSLFGIIKKREDREWWDQEDVRPRLIYWDDKHGQLRVYADYLVPDADEPLLSPLDFVRALGEGTAKAVNDRYFPPCDYFIRPKLCAKTSDHYHRDHPDYYRAFENGEPSDGTSIVELAEYRGNRWR